MIVYTFYLFIALLPYFEGCESPAGLFISHSLVLLLLVLLILKRKNLQFPVFLFYFLPFFLSLLVGTFVAPYRYSALLLLWDFLLAGIYILVITNLDPFFIHKEKIFIRNLFLIASLGLLLSVLLFDPLSKIRINGTFVNANDFGTYVLLLLLLGIFQYERETIPVFKKLTLTLLLLLGACLALTASRSVLLAGAVFSISYLLKKPAPRVLSLVVITVFLLMAFTVYFRFTQYPDPFQFYRLKIWKHSLIGTLENPYLGIGLNMLSYRAEQFNFPSEMELGRYSMIATSADSQYFQILAETGFVGLLSFLLGWILLSFAVRTVRPAFFPLKFSFVIITVVAFFSLPLHNTAIVFLFFFLILYALKSNQEKKQLSIPLTTFYRILIVTASIALFIMAVLLPYWAHLAFASAVRAKDPEIMKKKLVTAIRLNPYQPYYRFFLPKRVIEVRPNLSIEQWQKLLLELNHCIRLNPLEEDFYVYKARIYRILFEKFGDRRFYLQAIEAYQTAESHSPYDVFTLLEFAGFLYRCGETEEAAKMLKRILSLEPAFLRARLLLAVVEFHMGNISQAKEQLEVLENYERKYGVYRTTSSSGYIRNLLQLDEAEKNRLKKQISEIGSLHESR